MTLRNDPSDSAFTSAVQDENENEDKGKDGDDQSRADSAASSIRSQVASMASAISVQFGGLGASHNGRLCQEKIVMI